MIYTQLTCKQRYQIYALLKIGHKQTEISKCLGVHRSTICREIRRNKGGRGYRPKQAHQMAIYRRRKQRSRISERDFSRGTNCITGCKLSWSPDGKHIVFQDDAWSETLHNLFRLDIKTKEIVVLTDYEPTSIVNDVPDWEIFSPGW